MKRAFRVTMFWQGVATAAIAMLSGMTAGTVALVSAVIGGAIGIAGVLAFALVSMRKLPSADAAVRVALRAEAVKIAVIVLLLWLAFSGYGEMMVLPFFGAFMVSVLLSGIAFAASGD